MAPSPTPTHYLAVLKASYDYEPQSEDEIAIKEDQILFLLERTDDDWWKVKVKDSPEEDKGGLVPAAYVEPAPHKSVVKALYSYDASAPGELTVSEDELLQAFDMEDDWLLVQTESDGGKAGFVPASYVEETEGDEPAIEIAAPALQAHQIIVPPPPPSNYVDPAERVAAANASKAPSDSIETWSVSEVDKKGKKKKGTLGVGNGAVFFASESDKAPVQKWQISDVDSWRIEKSKHVHIEIGGTSPTSLHLHAGAKDTAEAITAKLQSSKGLSSPPPSQAPLRSSGESAGEESEDHEADTSKTTTPKKNGVNVHFSTAPPSIISPREPSEEGEGDYGFPSTSQAGGVPAIALYDFSADGEDELTVHENEELLVIERDGDDWWKCRNAKGKEGVVPASYLELTGSGTTNGVSLPDVSEEDERAAREAEEERLRVEKEEEERRRKEREQERERQRKKAEAERQAKAAAEAAEAERERRARATEEAKERERKADDLARAELERKSRQPRPSSSSAHASSSSRGKSTGRSPSPSRTKESSKSRASSDTKPRGLPSPQRTRLWHDKSGQYKVEAEFLGFSNGKLRLHKVNGVVIEVPLERMSAEDVKYIEKVTGKRSGSHSNNTGAVSDDDQPLAERRKSLQPEPKAPSKPPLPKKGPSIDWFEFFLNAGCDVDDCTRYASSFERDKIDESILADITEQTMRSLGLREGDIIRVKKAISQRQPTQREAAHEVQMAQMKADEELAKRLQAEENGLVPKRSTVSPAPNLFSAGPGGALKSTRRGRPQPSKSTLPANVDLNAIATASQEMSRGGSPVVALTTSPTSVTAPPRTSSAPISGFDDDAWTNRPSSTKPTPSPAATQADITRAPSAPPAQTSQPAQPAPATVATSPPPISAPVQPAAVPAQATAAPTVAATTAIASSPALAQTTESDVMKQLERLANLRTQSPTVPPPQQPSSINVTPVISTPPVSFQNGLGMGSSPLPLGQLQTQTTSFTPPGSIGPLGPRGPFAPVPANQGLLQPLIPTTTGFNSFVPTRPHSSPLPQQHMQSPPPVPPIPTQPTGFPMGMMQPQQTGFPTMAPMMTQATGFPPIGMGMQQQSPFANPPSFGGGLQPQPTGFNPGFGQFQAPSPPPPVPPLPSNATNNTSPANIFAAMKSGTFGNDSAPQTSDKYDALRPQPTGWGMQQGAGYPNGFSGVRY